jgi:hypothetical protein
MNRKEGDRQSGWGKPMVRTLNINAEISSDRELRITLPPDWPVGPAEIVLVVSSKSPIGERALGDLLRSEFLGMWSGRADITDSVDFARNLRSEGWKRSA